MVVVTTIRSAVAMLLLPWTLTSNPEQVLPPVTDPVFAKAVVVPSATRPPAPRAISPTVAASRFINVIT
jgi:hypothetical protein